jgi:hypothetical protein
MAHTFRRGVNENSGRRLKPAAPLLPHVVAVAESLDDFNRKVASGALVPKEAHRRLRTELDRVLDSGQAAAITYESYDLFPRPDTHAGHGDHSSIVAARRMIGGTCRYFVRNHFGRSCGYRPELEPRCEKENGGVWVSIGELRHLYSVISLR